MHGQRTSTSRSFPDGTDGEAGTAGGTAFLTNIAIRPALLASSLLDLKPRLLALLRSLACSRLLHAHPCHPNRFTPQMSVQPEVRESCRIMVALLILLLMLLVSCREVDPC